MHDGSSGNSFSSQLQNHLYLALFFHFAITLDNSHDQPDILAWYEDYLKKDWFVSDPVQKLVCTSNGTVVYLDLDLHTHCLVHISPTSWFATAVTATVDTDVNSVLCTYCNKTRHMADYCWKRIKHDQKRLKWLAVGANAAYDWGRS